MARKSKYSDAEIASILGQTSTGLSVREICRRHGFTEKTFYRWRARFGQRSLRGVPNGRMQTLEEENRRLRELVAQLSLDNFSLRQTHN